MRYSQILLSIAIGFATSSIAQEPRSNIGILTCSLAKSANAEPGSMTCGFKPSGSGAEEKYLGVARGAGQLEPTGKLVLVWAVMGPANTKVAPGVLAQRYVRAGSAGDTVPTLLGEENGAIALQFETNGGAQGGNDIGQVELRLAGTSA